MRIFIGCTTTHLVGKKKLDNGKEENNDLNEENLKEHESIAFLLNSKLKDSTPHIVMPWWEEETVPTGEDFFQKIQDLSDVCEFGIFIFSKENIKSTNTSGNDIYGTSENVLIEYGLFLGKNSDSKTFQIFEKGVDQISDLIKYNRKDYDFESDKNATVDKLLNLITNKIAKARKINENFAEYTLIANRETTEGVLDDDKIKTWKSKFLYVGRESANLWGDIEKDDNYISPQFDEKFKSYIENLELNGIDNIISFGPGIGSLDEIIVEGIVDNDFRYIPIDINPYLSMIALKRITQNGSFQKTYIPTAIVDDFEVRTSDLKNYIQTKITREKHTTLFLMMGGTFGNLEKPDSFLGTISTWIDNNDLFLLDAYVKDDNYEFELDKKNRLENSLLIPLIKNAINKKRLFYGEEPISESMAFDMFKNDTVRVTKVELEAGTNIYYKHKIKTNWMTVFTSKRFNNDKLYSLLEQKFKVDDSKHIKIAVDEKIGISRDIFLLQKK